MDSPLKQIIVSSYKKEMISFMNAHPEYFENAIKLAISDEPLFAWRSAWLLWSCMEENDNRVQRHIKDIINVIPNKEDNHQRELLKILLQMELNDKHESFLFDHCMTIWEQINKKLSVRFTAFKFIVKIAKKHHELSNEINFLTQNQYLESLSPAARKSISQMAKEFVR